MFTANRQHENGMNESVIRCASLPQLKQWAYVNGHAVIKGYAVRKALKSGAVIRTLNVDGRVTA